MWMGAIIGSKPSCIDSYNRARIDGVAALRWSSKWRLGAEIVRFTRIGRSNGLGITIQVAKFVVWIFLDRPPIV